MTETLEKKIGAWFDTDYRATFMERIEGIFEAENMYSGESDPVRYAHTLRHVLEKVSVPLKKDDVFAGSVTCRIPADDEYARCLEHYKKWWDIPLEERHKKTLFYYSEGWLKCRPPFFISYGHLALDWKRLVTKGIGDFRAEAAKAAFADGSKMDFEQGLIICYDAISAYILRYRGEAEKAGRGDLAEALSQIAAGPARTFFEALSLIWFVVLVCQKFCGCGVLNYSRMDQYLYPFYEADISSGRLDRARALAILEEFYFKNNEIMVQTDHMSQEIETTKYTLEVSYDDPNYLIVGGKKADGTGGVNPLSHLMIEAAHEMKLRNPFIVARWYEGIEQTFFEKTCEAMRDNATIVMYNDETMIPALKSYGVEDSEVYEYGFFGCNDPDISSYEGGLRQVWVNLVKPLELALQRGDYPMEPKANAAPRDCEFSLEDRMIGLMTGAYYGVDTGSLDNVKTMDDFLKLYRAQMNYLMAEYRRGFEKDYEIEKVCNRGRMRIEDCFLTGPVSEGVTWMQGGVKYHKIVTQGTGLATAADALYAIERLVFTDKEMTLKELAKILAENWAGRGDLAARLRKKYEKFGNDIDAVDKYAAIAANIFIDAVTENNGARYLYQMWPTLSSDRDFTTMGLYVGATPDGRYAAEPLSENQSPSTGADVSGLTALLNSVSKIPFDRITGGPLNVRIHPGSVRGAEGVKILAALFKTYMQKGGMQLQINVVDAETLRKAQQNPEKYRGLCVRVTGYSAFFVEMGKKAQEELIARTEKITA